MRPWIKKTLKWTGIVLGVLAVLYAGIILYSFHAVNQALARYHAQSFPTTYDELVHPTPDEDNAAVALQQLSDAIGKVPDFIEEVIKCLIPENTDTASCREYLAQHRAEIDAWRENNANKLAMIDDVLARPKYRINYPENDPEIFFPALSNAKVGAIYYLTVLDYYHDVKRGDISAAISKILRFCTLMHRYEDAAYNPANYLVAVVFRTKVLHDLGNIAQQGNISKEQALACLNYVKSIDLASSYRRMLTGDLLLYSLYFGKILSVDSDPRWNELPSFTRYWKKSLMYSIGGSYFFHFNLSEANTLNSLLDLYDQAEKPTEELVGIARRLDSQARIKSIFPIVPGDESRFSQIVFVGMVMHIARLNLIKTNLALALHKHIHGAYPPTLDAIDPAILTRVPQDIFAEQPLAYAVSSNGTYTLSSPGLEAFQARPTTQSP
ncbi:MAG: hypothetical protein AB1916_03775 [Thermodesulfobacteriota bacterium]